MRGSSMPQLSSRDSFGLDLSVGSRSISHPSTPFCERAAQRCEMPRRSSTRHSSNVEPSASSVAPALNTLLIEYGQSLLLKIGLAGCRRSRVSWPIVTATLIGFTQESQSEFRWKEQQRVRYPSHVAANAFQ